MFGPSKNDLEDDIHELKQYMFGHEYGVTNAALSKRLRDVEQKLNLLLDKAGLEPEYRETKEVVGLRVKTRDGVDK